MRIPVATRKLTMLGRRLCAEPLNRKPSAVEIMRFVSQHGGADRGSITTPPQRSTRVIGNDKLAKLIRQQDMSLIEGYRPVCGDSARTPEARQMKRVTCPHPDFKGATPTSSPILVGSDYSAR